MRPEGLSTLGEMLVAKNILPETARILQCRYLRSRLANALFPSRDRKGVGFLVHFFKNFSTPRRISSVIRAIALVSTPDSTAASNPIASM
jgi:hypothetical protein